MKIYISGKITGTTDYIQRFERAEKASERLAQLMIDAPKGKIDIPMKVDCEITRNWYGEEVEV